MKSTWLHDALAGKGRTIGIFIFATALVYWIIMLPAVGGDVFVDSLPFAGLLAITGQALFIVGIFLSLTGGQQTIVCESSGFRCKTSGLLSARIPWWTVGRVETKRVLGGAWRLRFVSTAEKVEFWDGYNSVRIVPSIRLRFDEDALEYLKAELESRIVATRAQRTEAAGRN
jgi:hypothetical protein